MNPTIDTSANVHGERLALMAAIVGHMMPIMMYGGGTAISVEPLGWETNSGMGSGSNPDNTIGAIQPYNNNRQFIMLIQSFKKQYGNVPAFEGQNKFLLEEKLKISADAILQIVPDKISLQLTPEGSAFYTAIKGDVTIFLQHYLIDEFDSSDEAIVTVFTGNEKKMEYAGSLQEIFEQMSEELYKYNINLSLFA